VFFCEAIPSNGNAHFPLHSPRDNLDIMDPDKLASDAEVIWDCLHEMLPRHS